MGSLGIPLIMLIAQCTVVRILFHRHCPWKEPACLGAEEREASSGSRRLLICVPLLLAQQCVLERQDNSGGEGGGRSSGAHMAFCSIKSLESGCHNGLGIFVSF